MANEYELQRLIQQAKQNQANAQAQAQREAEQARITRKLAIESTFRQELERDLSIEVCRALSIQYEWVSITSDMALAVLAIYSYIPDKINYDNLPEHWENMCYVATFMFQQQKMGIFRCRTSFGTDSVVYHLYNHSFQEQRKPGYSPGVRPNTAVFRSDNLRDGLLLCLDKMREKGPFEGYYFPR